MNIKQALKRKNQLVKEINTAISNLQTYNSIEDGNVRPYDPEQLTVEIRKKTEELVELKTKIHRANSPVYDKIFMMSELKSLINNLKFLDCSSGSKYHLRHEHPVFKHATISVLDRDTMISEMENTISEIQDQLDIHNSNTEI
jgi:hypothetical protein